MRRKGFEWIMDELESVRPGMNVATWKESQPAFPAYTMDLFKVEYDFPGNRVLCVKTREDDGFISLIMMSPAGDLAKSEWATPDQPTVMGIPLTVRDRVMYSFWTARLLILNAQDWLEHWRLSK